MREDLVVHASQTSVRRIEAQETEM